MSEPYTKDQQLARGRTAATTAKTTSMSGERDTLDRLDALRRRLPLVWWLIYDAIVAVVIIAGVSPSDPLFYVGLGWLFVAAIIDAVEFLAKRRLAYGR